VVNVSLSYEYLVRILIPTFLKNDAVIQDTSGSVFVVQLQIKRLLQIQRIVSQGIFVLQRALICTCIHIQKHSWICVASKEREQQQIYTHMYILGALCSRGRLSYYTCDGAQSFHLLRVSRQSPPRNVSAITWFGWVYGFVFPGLGSRSTQTSLSEIGNCSEHTDFIRWTFSTAGVFSVVAITFTSSSHLTKMSHRRRNRGGRGGRGGICPPNFTVGGALPPPISQPSTYNIDCS